MQRLLSPGSLLSQALEQWQSHAIWVISRADAQYPRRLKIRLREDAPAVLYGCGDLRLLEAGGLAVVGARHVDDSLIAYTEAVGALAASVRRNIVSGGAKGIDQAAMRGALQAGGTVCGVLPDNLQRTVMKLDQRDALLAVQLLLISPWYPSAGFNVGHAMQRNKLVYALADAALVVSSDAGKGGTPEPVPPSSLTNCGWCRCMGAQPTRRPPGWMPCAARGLWHGPSHRMRRAWRPCCQTNAVQALTK